MGTGNPAPESSHGPFEKMPRMVIDFKISMWFPLDCHFLKTDITVEYELAS